MRSPIRAPPLPNLVGARVATGGYLPLWAMTSSPNRGDDVITYAYIWSNLMEHHNYGGDKKGVPGCASLFPWPTLL